MNTDPESQAPPREGGAGTAKTTDDTTSIVPQTDLWGNLPDELKRRKAWVCWRLETRDGKPTKVPYNPTNNRRAKSNDPRTWTDFGEALAHASRFDGLGIMFADRLCGVDLDHVRDPQTGALEPWAAEAVAALDSYTEASPSGTGVHVLLLGELPPGGRRKGPVEVYGPGSPRYFTVTGDHLPNTPTTPQERSAELAVCHRRFIGPKAKPAEKPSEKPPAPVDLADAALLDKARAAKNGSAFVALFDHGDTSAHRFTNPDGTVNEGRTEAELALCGHLAFWCGGDPGRMDRLFRASGLMRAKWNRADYRERTIRLALAGTTEFYRPGGNAMAANTETPPADQIAAAHGAASAEKREEENPVAEVLVAIAEAEAEFFRDQDGEPYATVPVDKHHETFRVAERGGGGLRNWIVRRFREEAGRTPHATGVAQAIMALVAEAAVAPVKAVGLRVAEADGALWLDLGNAAFEVVRITSEGWFVTADLPGELRFLRPPGMRALPRPKHGGGGLADLRGLLNPAEEPDGFVLIVAWLLATLRPGYPYPVLDLLGEQGTGKSTAARILRLLVDPLGEGGTGLTRPPKDDRDLFAIATNTHVLALDNVSSIPADLSDSLSALATGAGLQARRLFTDSDLAATYARRPIILNGIGTSGSDIAGRPDLLDRTLCVPLAPVPDERRIQEADLWPEVRRLAPGVLADLLDGMACAMKRLPTLDLPPLPRMADFAAWVIAAEPALPWEEGSFLRVYSHNRTQATDALLEGDPLAKHVMALAESGWTGTSSELLSALEGLSTEAERKRKGWPGTAVAVGKHLTKIGPALRSKGIQVERDRAPHKGTRIIAIRRTDSGDRW